MTTLYRKHRPQTFGEVVGQNHIKTTIQYEIASGKLAHAYLFCGPRGIGKTTLARVIARAVNCAGRGEQQSEPCNECESCLSIRENRSIDIIEIDAASHTGVDNVRENVIAAARVRPVHSKFKVFIIDEAHMLSISAFNSLLKIMEEPPSYVIFILCTTESHKVPATIVSRCQRFDFKKIGSQDMIAKLERIAREEGLDVDKEVLFEVARHSEGHMRDAESVLGQIASVSSGKITMDEASLVIPRSNLAEVGSLLAFISRKDAAGAVKLLNVLAEDGVDMKAFTRDAIEAARKLMLAKLSPALSDRFSRDWGGQIEEKMAEAGAAMDATALAAVIAELGTAREELRGSFIIQLPLEMAVLRLCSLPARQTLMPPSAAPAAASAPVRAGGAGIAEDSAENSLELDVVTEKWGEVLTRVLKYNHSLSFILKVCQPKEVSGSRLCLAFKYKFHKDRIDNPEIKQMVEQALQEVFGKRFDVHSVVDETVEIETGQPASLGGTPQPSPEAGENSEMINDILKTFGGKVVG